MSQSIFESSRTNSVGDLMRRKRVAFSIPTSSGGAICYTKMLNDGVIDYEDDTLATEDQNVAKYNESGLTLYQGYNLCRASVQQVYEDEGSKYSSCTTCRKKVTLSGADYWCFRCNANETNPNERFKLQIQLPDKHWLLDVTVFSETASELLDISLTKTNNLTKNRNTATEEVHNQLMKAIGNGYLFRVRVDDYNV